MNATNSTLRRHRARRWATAPLVAAIAAGAVCAGVGVGSAATTTSTDLGAETSGHRDMQVTNGTGGSIRVTVDKFVGEKPVGWFEGSLGPGNRAYGTLYADPADVIRTKINVEGLSACWVASGVEWNDLYILDRVTPSGSTRFVTGRGGLVEHPLTWGGDSACGS